MFIAVGKTGTILGSSDGITWADHSISSTNDFSAVTYGSGAFVGVGFFRKPPFFSQTPIIWRSTDGINWSLQTLPYVIAHDIAYAQNSFAVVGDDGAIFSSPDGVNWTARASGTGGTLYAVTGGKG